MHSRKGALRYDQARGRYAIDRGESLSIAVGELLLHEILSARPYLKGRLLDVGCGKRPYALFYNDLVQQSIGTEVAFSPHGTFAADVINYAEALPFPDQSFDTILCTEVLEHTREPFLAMREFARVLKPGGHLLLSVPFLYPVHEAPHDYWRFTNHGLEASCRAVGLIPIYIHQKGGIGATLVSFWANLAVLGSSGLSKLLQLSSPLHQRGVVRWWLVMPQWVYLWLARRVRMPAELSKFSAWMTPGYVLLAQRPANPSVGRLLDM